MSESVTNYNNMNLEHNRSLVIGDSDTRNKAYQHFAKKFNNENEFYINYYTWQDFDSLTSPLSKHLLVYYIYNLKDDSINHISRTFMKYHTYEILDFQKDMKPNSNDFNKITQEFKNYMNNIDSLNILIKEFEEKNNQ